MKLLIVEDEKRVAEFLKIGLEDDYEIDIAFDGVVGCAKALDTTNNYSLIILDLMLPGKDGFTILKEIRKDDVLTPVLLLTARGDVEDRIKGLDLGADDYLPKPFSLEELQARIRSITRRTYSNKETILKVNDLELDTISHIAYRNEEQIELTSKEYVLLEYLMRHKNRTLSRQDINSAIWNGAYEPGSNIIDVYVKRIRTKINDTNENQMIQSIRGVGYRFRDYS